MIKTPTILQKIIAQKQTRVEAAKKEIDYGKLITRVITFRENETPYRFRNAFTDENGINVIAEIKRASPSKGVINANFDVAEIARKYQEGGACAISVLTEEDNFGGSIKDFITARNLTDLPILRKDFIFDEFQVYESALIGADAILLITAMLSDGSLKNLYSLAHNLGLDVLVETHNFCEIKRALEIGVGIIGVNNRDLNTFEVSLDTSRNLISYLPKNVLAICESGLKRKEELIEMKALGFNGFLVGETLMKSENVSENLMKLVRANVPASQTS